MLKEFGCNILFESKFTDYISFFFFEETDYISYSPYNIHLFIIRRRNKKTFFLTFLDVYVYLKSCKTLNIPSNIK